MTARKKRGLGRGLDALLGQGGTTAAVAAGAAGFHNLPLDQVHQNPRQPRRHFDEESLAELANSIRAGGVIQPVVVRPRTNGGYELVAGERRWRASRLAEQQTIPAVVRELDDRSTSVLALTENLQRQDLNAIEQAEGLQSLIQEFGLQQKEAAEMTGISRSAVTNLLRLLSLPEEARELLVSGKLEMGHARALLGLLPEFRTKMARQVAAEGWSVRQTEERVRRITASGKREKLKSVSSGREDPDVQRLERELAEHLGAPVQVQHTTRGRGRLVVRYSSTGELEGILERIGMNEKGA